ncbi:MAG TPA: winged helix-turn-helix domain-containing protein [Pseudomonadales bacterium]
MHYDTAIEYHFAGFQLDARQKKLRDEQGNPVALSARPLDALTLLLERHGEVLSREELLEAVWPQLFVEENNLTQAISTIRKALNDNPSESHFIRTVPGRGYCFIAPVEKRIAGVTPGGECPRASAARGRSAALPRLWAVQALALAVAIVVGLAVWSRPDVAGEVPEKAGNWSPLGISDVPRPDSRIPNSIAVLPLVTLGEDYDPLFTAGLHDEVISELTKIPSLHVIARSSVLALQEGGSSILDLARVLRVESILSGTIRPAGTEARISLQLLDVSSGLTTWAGTYDIARHDLAETISVQGDIARNVATAMKAEMPNTDSVDFATLPTEQLKAHRFNRAARNALGHQQHADAWRLAQKAIALDPDFYDALDTFASVNIMLIAAPLPGLNGRRHAELALEHANRMIDVAPQHGEGYALKAAALAAGGDWSGAAAAIDVLQDMNAPRSRLEFVGLVLLARGDFEQAADIYEATLLTDLVNPYARGLLMAAHELAGRRDTARAKFATGQELHGQWWGDTVNVLLALGRYEMPQDVDDLVGISDTLRDVLAQAADADVVSAAVRAYQPEAATSSIETLYYAALAARLNDHDAAVDLLRSATRDVWSGIFWAWLPVFDDTRRQASFRQLLHDAGLVAYWERAGWPRMCQPETTGFRCDWSAYPLVISAIP